MRKIWRLVSIVSPILLVLCAAFAITTYNSLGYVSSQLSSTEKELTDTQNQLTSKSAQLDSTITEWNSTKAQLTTAQNTIEIQVQELDSLNNQLKTANNNLKNTQTLLQSAQDQNTQLLSSYSSMRDEINARFGLTQQDRERYITPSDTTIATKVKEITGGYSADTSEYYRDCERLYQWVKNNIDYSSDSYLPILSSSPSATFEWRKDFWRMPSETLTDGTGDCEDMALLLISMMINYNQGIYDVWLITIKSDISNSAHLAVAFPVKGGHIVILDPAGKYYTGLLSGSWLYSENVTIEINSWLTYWNNKMPSAYVSRIFSEDTDQQFSSTAAFLTWFERR